MLCSLAVSQAIVCPAKYSNTYERHAKLQDSGPLDYVIT